MDILIIWSRDKLTKNYIGNMEYKYDLAELSHYLDFVPNQFDFTYLILNITHSKYTHQLILALIFLT